MQLEIRPGDHAYFDGSNVDRAQLSQVNSIPFGTPIGIDFQFMMQPNGPNNTFVNTASWADIGVIHDNGPSTNTGSAPVWIGLDGDHLNVGINYRSATGNSVPGGQTLWTDPNPIVPGQYSDIRIEANVTNNSSGYVKVWVNGTQAVNYQGPLGYGNSTYWIPGIYRSADAPQTLTVDFHNMTLVTGSQAIGWTGVGGTTPTTPTAPVNVAPTVTQASASPGTGVEHAGDTITMTLGFSEAVTVTGTPTLSLNDGGTATYVGGSGTSSLTFKTTVASTDKDTSALAITGVNLPTGASIKDGSGLAANLSGAVKTFSGLQINPVQPAVTQAAATPGTGTEHVGDTITLSLAFNEAVTVTGTPTLSLNDGSKATYFGGSGTGTLTFKTTVASTDTSTSALAITGVNLPSGTAIKDASGIAANLSAAVKTFSGLAVSTAPVTPTAPTTPTTPTAPTTPSATTPVLTIADHSLWVAGRGGKVDLGTQVTTTDSNDVVTVNITGLPKYETITDKLDGQTFRGNNITLTAAQVDSGLTLTSTYRGGGHPTATLTLTASAKDPTTGAVATASPQTITVVDPRPATTTTTTTSSHHHHHTATNQQPVATTTAVAPTTSHTTESTDHQHTTAANTGSLASQGFALLQQHFDPAASTLATTAAHPIMAADHPAATGTTMASFASQSFALLNQYLAAHTGHVDPGQFVAALSRATGWGGHDSLLARPQH
nr:heparin lyase I family protein [Bradyrhizobium diazoefficiens]